MTNCTVNAVGLDTLYGGLGPGALAPGAGLAGISWTVTVYGVSGDVFLWIT